MRLSAGRVRHPTTGIVDGPNDPDTDAVGILHERVPGSEEVPWGLLGHRFGDQERDRI